MNPPIRLLHLEDDPRDAELIRLWLQSAGLDCDIICANGRASFESALAQGSFDLVLSDYNVPGYDGLSALRHVRQVLPELPVIIISGGLSEEGAVDCLKSGAVDYVLKQRPQRLDNAIRRALVERDERAALRRAQEEILRHNAELEQRVRERTAELQEANRFLDSVIENIPNMIFIKDAADLRFVRFNRAGEDLLGYSREELRGKNDYDFFPRAEADFFTSCDREVLALGVVKDIPEEAIHTRGKGGRILHTRKIPLLDESGQPHYLLGISEDVTPAKEREGEILRLNAALERRTLEADSANQAKSGFLATMSHEIRTPLNGMFGMLELLGLGELSAEQRATLAIVRESGQSLLRIIDDILDFSKIEAGKLEIRPTASSIAKAVASVNDMYAGNASSKGLLLRHSVDAAISPALLVDPLRLRQILNNFVSNAIKFTPKGCIDIDAEMVAREAGRELVRFTVSDTGVGVSPKDQQRLFQPFSQIDGEATRHASGTGLGLSICRRLARLMGGDVTMASEVGRGTTMTLFLSMPIADPADVPADPAGASRAEAAFTSARVAPPSIEQARAEGTLVLVADDHPTNRMLLVRQLQTLGYAAESVEDGSQALEQWKTGRFALVVSDCNMPRMDGYELARAIRAIESAQGLRRTPIVACTANALPEEAARCADAGMDDCLVKPVQLSQLARKMAQHLPRRDDRAGDPPDSSGVTNGAVPVDLALIALNWGGSEGVVRDILAAFRAANDKDSAKLRQAVAGQDMPQVTHCAHRMLGAGSMVGARDFASACERIDHASRAGDWDAVHEGMRAFEREYSRLDAYFESL